MVRGFDSIDGGLVLTDGAPEPEISFYQLYNVERVEVLKGPGGFLYGRNPLAGTVNLVRKQPVPETLRRGRRRGRQLRHLRRRGRLERRRRGRQGFDFRLNGL